MSRKCLGSGRHIKEGVMCKRGSFIEQEVCREGRMGAGTVSRSCVGRKGGAVSVSRGC